MAVYQIGIKLTYSILSILVHNRRGFKKIIVIIIIIINFQCTLLNTGERREGIRKKSNEMKYIYRIKHSQRNRFSVYGVE